MAALYSHQRSHKTRSGTEPDSVGGSYTAAPLDQFSPQSQDAPDSNDVQIPGSNVDFQGLNGNHDQNYFEQNFHEEIRSDQMNSGIEGDNADEEEEDGDLCQCSLCGNSYTSMRALRSHLRGHTQSHGTPASSGPSSMSSHEEVKDEEAEEMMICSTCGESFANSQDLITHQLLHDKEQVDSVNQLHMNKSGVSEAKEEVQSICGSCGIFCTSFHHLTNHGCSTERTEKSTHTEQEMKGNDVSQHDDTTDNKETFDTEDRQYKCDQCGRSYRHAGSLLNHKKSHKTGVFRCLVCQKRFYNLLALKNHQRKEKAGVKKVLKPRAFKCKECKKAFVSVDKLTTHTCDAPPGRSEAQTSVTRIKEERPFKCMICNRSYRHAGSLLNHKNTHKTGHFSCTFCSKPFTNPMALRNHTRIHTQKKKYVCLTCGKAFRLASILHNHQRIHSRAASHFRCSACGKSFQGRSGLKRHRCRRGQENAPRAGVQQTERGDKCFM
ncbi:hypothetical protein F7725_014128 [Dissostichus mawsoni]|uniref:C2H2-type domain-containing protein n=1 Tax=Dissostichus mawsoni TaxID=36200 RepID=A0A7J5YVG7_DISMA|nr:hypothetical protein F7725_014128 [Dissostichus mawsoni]